MIFVIGGWRLMVGAFGSVPLIPVETFQAARKIYNLRHIYVRIGDHIPSILARLNLPDLDPSFRLDHDFIVRLALAASFQFAEFLPDMAASEATARRMDWKYALYLPIDFPGIPADAIREFRQNVCSAEKGVQAFGILLNQLTEFGLFPRVRSRPLDPVEALTGLCQINWIDQLDQAMRNALGLLVSLDPEWLRNNALPHWYERFQSQRSSLSYPLDPSQLAAKANSLTGDIAHLLALLSERENPDLVLEDDIRALRRLINKQSIPSGAGSCWPESGCFNNARLPPVP